MRGLKTLSTFFLLLGLAAVMAGSAAADIGDPDTEIDKDVADADFNGERVAYVQDQRLYVTDEDGEDIYDVGLDKDADAVVIDDDNDVYHSNSGQIEKFDDEGNKEWDYQSSDGGGTYDIDVNDEYVVIGGVDVYVSIVDKETGSEELDTGSVDRPSQLMAGEDFDGMYYSDGDTLFKLDKDGSEVWDENAPDEITGITQLDNDHILVGTTAGEIVEFTESGSEEEVTDASEDEISDLSSDENILVGTEEGRLKEYTDSYSKESDKEIGDGSYLDSVKIRDDKFMTQNDQVRLFGIFTLPEDKEVSEDSTDLATGDFALSSSVGIYGAVKGAGGIAGSLAAWELGVEDWLFGTNDDDEELFKSDIRGNAVNLEDQRENILDSSEISQDALFGDAMSTAKSEGVQSFNNGSTRDESKEKVEETVEDYYSDVERTIVNGYNNEVLNLQQDRDNAENIDVSFSEPFKEDFDELAVTNETYTLPNGEEMETYEVVDDSGTKIMTLEDDSGTGLETESTDDHDSAQYVSGSAHYDVIEGVRDTRSDAISNVNDIIDEIHDNNEQGDINVSDELNALELTESLSTEYEETGSYDYAAASLARTGEPTDLESAFNITYDDEDLEGALFASDDVVGEDVETEETYDGSDGNAVFVAQRDDEAELVELDDEFTVNSITSTDGGEELNSTSLQEESAYTQNTSDLQSDIESLQEEYEETQSSGGSAGPTGDFLSSPTGAMGAIIAGLLLVILGAYVS